MFSPGPEPPLGGSVFKLPCILKFHVSYLCMLEILLSAHVVSCV